jgi:hypothetical protein
MRTPHRLISVVVMSFIVSYGSAAAGPMATEAGEARGSALHDLAGLPVLLISPPQFLHDLEPRDKLRAPREAPLVQDSGGAGAPALTTVSFEFGGSDTLVASFVAQQVPEPAILLLLASGALVGRRFYTGSRSGCAKVGTRPI